MRGLFVTGTGTGVGKTVLSASLLAALAAAGKPVRAHKPVLTGLPDPAQGGPPNPSPAQSGQPSPEQSRNPDPAQSGQPSPAQSRNPDPEQRGQPSPAQSRNPDPEQRGQPSPAQSRNPDPEQRGQPSPAQSGNHGQWPPDHELLALAAGMAPEDVAPLRYRPAVSPHLAAQLAGEQLDPARLLAAARGEDNAATPAPGAPGAPLTTAYPDTHAHATSHLTAHATARAGAHAQEPLVIVEGVGGLLVPLAGSYTVRDLALQLGLPLLIAAHPGLGTINHTLLTLHCARAAGLHVCAVVLTPWPAQPSTMERSNRETIARLGAVEVEGLPYLPRPELNLLARAGASLPWQRWL